MHVAIAHQDELRVDFLREECVGKGFVELGHGRGTTLNDEVGGYASMPGDAPSIPSKRPFWTAPQQLGEQREVDRLAHLAVAGVARVQSVAAVSAVPSGSNFGVAQCGVEVGDTERRRSPGSRH